MRRDDGEKMIIPHLAAWSSTMAKASRCRVCSWYWAEFLWQHGQAQWQMPGVAGCAAGTGRNSYGSMVKHNGKSRALSSVQPALGWKFLAPFTGLPPAGVIGPPLTAG